jgi:hypothetical protein
VERLYEPSHRMSPSLALRSLSTLISWRREGLLVDDSRRFERTVGRKLLYLDDTIQHAGGVFVPPEGLVNPCGRDLRSARNSIVDEPRDSLEAPPVAQGAGSGLAPRSRRSRSSRGAS